ncbi:MAG: hypothetical protein LUG91_05480 [Ruminococcus sp.]|nr:hypothetical protein [Ruminococcus sp.]
MNDLKISFEGNTMIVSEVGYPTRTFQIVDSVPQGYEIWSIGKHMPEGYLPLCKIKAQQPSLGGREIEIDTLKAIKINGAEKILEATARGQSTIKKMETYIKRYKNAKPGTRSHAQVRRIEAVLPIMRQIKWQKEEN